MGDTLFSELNGRKTVSIPEVAKALGCDAETVRKCAISGAIPGAFQLRTEGNWRFRVSILEAWWAKQGIKS
jgi:hypothetical protein